MRLSHCGHNGLVRVQDEARLRQGHNDQSRQGHQCSETTLTGESRFHINIPLGIEPRSLMRRSKWVDHWTGGTVYECSEIAGSPQFLCLLLLLFFHSFLFDLQVSACSILPGAWRAFLHCLHRYNIYVYNMIICRQKWTDWLLKGQGHNSR